MNKFDLSEKDAKELIELIVGIQWRIEALAKYGYLKKGKNYHNVDVVWGMYKRLNELNNLLKVNGLPYCKKDRSVFKEDWFYNLVKSNFE